VKISSVYVDKLVITGRSTAAASKGVAPSNNILTASLLERATASVGLYLNLILQYRVGGAKQFQPITTERRIIRIRYQPTTACG